VFVYIVTWLKLYAGVSASVALQINSANMAVMLGDIAAVFLGQLGFAVLVGAYVAVNPIAICEIFPRAVRCSAVSTAYNITVGVVGGTAPVVATWLIEQTAYPLAPALYIMLGAGFSAAAALSVRDSSRQAMEEPAAPLATATGSGT
jgi:hypothetical protein